MKIRTAPIILFFFCFLSFYIGTRIDTLIENPATCASCESTPAEGDSITELESIQERQREYVVSNLLFMAIIPSGVFAIAAGYLDWLIRQEIEDGKQEDLNKFYFYTLRKFDNLRNTLATIELSQIQREQCMEALQPASIAIENFENIRLVAYKLSKWLNQKSNFLSLRDQIVREVFEQIKIEPELTQLLVDDVGNFLIWLNASLSLRQGYRLNRNRLKLLNSGYTNFLTVYKLALRKIQNHQTLKQIAQDSDVLGDFMDDLERHILQIIRQA